MNHYFRTFFNFILGLLLVLLKVVEISFSSTPVLIEFLYYYDPCPTCPKDLYIYNSEIINHIVQEYGDNVSVLFIDFYSAEGEEKRKQYNIEVWEQNAIVINSEVVITGYANETYIREYIDYFLGLKPSPPTSPQQYSPPSPPNLPALLLLSFTFGFFETFSPCLIILLSFILSYTVTELTSPKEKFFKVMTFGLGFITATLIIFAITTVGVISVITMLQMQRIFMWVVCALTIVFGLDLLGVKIFNTFLKTKFETKPLLQRLTKKYAFTYIGLATLGFIFYFLDPCIAPIFVVLVGVSQTALLSEFLPVVLLVFCFGVIIPFLGIGFLSSSISKLVRRTYRYRSKIRAISGVILISYAIYLLLLYTFFNSKI